jgi:prevent-host-death family protein
MKMIPLSAARSGLTDVVNEVAYAGKRVILTRKGKMLAVIVSLADLKALEAMGKKQSLNTGLKKRPVKRKRKVSPKLEAKREEDRENI